MARIMVIAGGAWQCPLVRKAKELGHYVICSNLYDDSPAFEYADVGVVANVIDKEKNLKIALEYKPDAIVTDQSDIAIPTVAYVAQKMGLKGIGIETAERFTNKYKMREYAARFGIPIPKYRLCHSISEAKEFLAFNPVSIMKPLDSQSSRGIHIVKKPEDIEKNYSDSILYSSTEKSILIEEYIDGTEFTVDGIKTSSEYVVTAISQKDHYDYNPNIARKLLFSNSNEQYDYDRLRKENSKLIQAMGLSFGLTHTEYKYRNGQFYLIETAARGGGTKISSDITKLVSGIDTNKIYLNMAIGEMDQITRDDYYNFSVLGFFNFKPGIVTKITGIETAMNLPGVHDMKIEINTGDLLEKAKDDRSRCGYYIIFADSKAELELRERRLLESVRVETR